LSRPRTRRASAADLPAVRSAAAPLPSPRRSSEAGRRPLLDYESWREVDLGIRILLTLAAAWGLSAACLLAQETPPAPTAQPSQSSNYFNPSVSVIGNFLGVAGHNPVENLPTASLRESEVALQAIVDPYARADFFLSFSESGVEVE